MNYNNNYPNLTLLVPGGEGILGTAIDWNTMLTQASWNDPDLRLDLIRYAADRLQEAIRNGVIDPSSLYYDGELVVSEVADIAGLPDMFDSGLLADALDMARRIVLLANGYVSPEEHRKRELLLEMRVAIEQGNISQARRYSELINKTE